MKPLTVCLEDQGTSVAELVKTSGLDAKLVKAIVDGNYTASPAQRQKLADALGIAVQEVAWGHSVPVQHLRGNGPIRTINLVNAYLALIR